MDPADAEELLRDALAAWNADDLARVMPMVHPDAVMVAPRGWPEFGTFRGRREIEEQFRQVKAPWRSDRIRVRRFEHHGAWVLAVTRWTVHGEASGVDLDQDLYLLYRFQGRRMAEIRFFVSEEDARAVAAERSGG